MKATGAAVAAAGVARAAGAKRPPNIVFIILDELGYYELSCMGHPVLETPNIDRMAAEGMRFTQALAGGPVCAPTRSCLMTGQHMGHTTVRTNGGYTPIRDDDVTVAEVLKQAGYATGGFGKWGIGGRGTSGVPEKHGFDVFFGYYDQRHAHTYYPEYLIRNSEEVPLPGNTGDFYTGKTHAQYPIFDEAVKFIEANAAPSTGSGQARPFFCYCPWTPPHGLWGIPKDDPSWLKYKDKPWTAGQRTPNDAKVYAAMVNLIDRQIGEILATLKKHGLDENTIVFVCGDNGGQDYFRTKDRPRGFFAPNVDPRSGVEFRGMKGDLYEGGLRVPMIVRWPGKVKAGAVSDHVWYFPDVMPTLAELAGVAAPRTTDGISIAPTLLGGAGRKQELHEYLYWEYGKQVAVRMGDWKAVTSKKGGAFELYDLSKDVSEKRNVAGKHADVLAKMKAFARQAHTPPRAGTVLNKALAEKDHGAGHKRDTKK